MKTVLFFMVMLINMTAMAMAEELSDAILDSGDAPSSSKIWVGKRLERLRRGERNFNDLCALIDENDVQRFQDHLEKLKSEGVFEDIIKKIKNPDGLNLLQCALKKEKINPRIIKLILKQGIDVNTGLEEHVYKSTKSIYFYKGWTAAHFARAFRQSPDIVSLLKKNKCDFSKKDAGGWSANKVKKYYDKKNRKKMKNESREIKDIPSQLELSEWAYMQRTFWALWYLFYYWFFEFAH